MRPLPQDRSTWTDEEHQAWAVGGVEPLKLVPSMPDISIVVPTVTGREDLLTLTKAAFAETSGNHTLEWIVLKDRGGCGAAWQEGAQLATGRYLLLHADDMVPHTGWADHAIRAAKHGRLPSPRILNPDGSVQNCGTMGGGMLLGDCAEGTPCNAAPLLFFDRKMWPGIGPCPPIHYYSDDLLSHRARCAGLTVVVWPGFCFTHLEGTVGRPAMVDRAMKDRAEYLRLVAEG